MATTKVPTPPSKTASKTANLTPSPDAEASKAALDAGAAAAVNPNPPKSLSGLTEINYRDASGNIISTSTEVYRQGDPELYYGKLNVNDRINLQGNLRNIVGLYAKGKEPKYLDGNFRPEDFDALGKVMAFADISGFANIPGASGKPDFPKYGQAILKLQSNPQAAAAYFNYKVPAGPNYNLTPLDMAAADLSSAHRSILGTDPTTKQIAAYHSAVNKIETNQKGQFSAAQRDALIISSIQKEAAALVAKASNPDDKDALAKISTGNLGGYINAIRTTYIDNGISFTEDKIRKQGVAALKDKASYDNIIADIHSKAAIFVPAFKDGINAGKSARDVLSPYISMYAKTYGIPEDQVKIDDVAFAGADDKPMMPKDFNMAITNAPKFKTSDTYKNNIADGLNNLATKMGIVV